MIEHDLQKIALATITQSVTIRYVNGSWVVSADVAQSLPLEGVALSIEHAAADLWHRMYTRGLVNAKSRQIMTLAERENEIMPLLSELWQSADLNGRRYTMHSLRRIRDAAQGFAKSLEDR